MLGASHTGQGSGRSRPKKIPPPPSSGPFDNDGSNHQSIERLERVAKPKPNKPNKAKKKPNRGVDVSWVDLDPTLSRADQEKVRDRLATAARHFQNDRFEQAEQLLRAILRTAPRVAEVHELLGLCLYRQGIWKPAIRELETFTRLTGSVEQHPVLADCYRALKAWKHVDRLWEELGSVSPSPDLIEEGRIVRAGALADQGRLSDAIRFLERAPQRSKSSHKAASPGQLRRRYALADLYERSGDTARARRLFSDITMQAPEFGDVAERVASLS